MPDKNERRAQREHAVDSLNIVAQVLEIEPIPVRASAEEVTELYESLCEKGSAEHRERIAQAREEVTVLFSVCVFLDGCAYVQWPTSVPSTH